MDSSNKVQTINVEMGIEKTVQENILQVFYWVCQQKRILPEVNFIPVFFQIGIQI